MRKAVHFLMWMSVGLTLAIARLGIAFLTMSYDHTRKIIHVKCQHHRSVKGSMFQEGHRRETVPVL